ncbi:MAG: rod shape-determining protein MreC [Muribaculaceae bacterium]|nr:rod shape-determining protein MreC [Muribaculaceae bacterium]
MNNLLQFLVKHVPWFVFIIYVVISCILLFRSNPYQQSVYLSSANGISSTVYEGYSGISSYFGLKSVNEDLQARNTELELEVAQLKKQLNNYKLQIPDTTGILAKSKPDFTYVVANVISNSVAQPANFITIDRGSEDGIVPEMGVVGHNGVVGIVNVVGKHSARIISLINPYIRLSCKVKKNGKFGTLKWIGEDYRYATLTELPRDGKYTKGDSVVTSGYSALFPEGIMVGIVEGEDKTQSSNFMAVKVRLSTDFSQLKNVSALNNKMRVELKALESKDNDPSGAKKEEKK